MDSQKCGKGRGRRTKRHLDFGPFFRGLLRGDGFDKRHSQECEYFLQFGLPFSDPFPRQLREGAFSTGALETNVQNQLLKTVQVPESAEIGRV